MAQDNDNTKDTLLDLMVDCIMWKASKGEERTKKLSKFYEKWITIVVNWLIRGTLKMDKLAEFLREVMEVPECDLDDVLNEITTRYDEMTKGLKTE